MPFNAELTIDNQVFVVRDFYLSVFRETNTKGQPNSSPAWMLDVTIDVIKDTTITQWMIDPEKQIDGDLVIYKENGEGKMKKIEFTNSSCYSMIDRFIPEFSETSCYIRIAGAGIKLGNAKLAND